MALRAFFSFRECTATEAPGGIALKAIKKRVSTDYDEVAGEGF